MKYQSQNGTLVKTCPDPYSHKEELQDYIENAAIALHWVDANGMITWANQAELDMLGYTEEEYIGHHISEFHTDPEKIKDILLRLGSNETLKGYESSLRCKNGSIRDVQISSNVFWEEGKFIHTRCFTVDITDQKLLFKALNESESRYRQLIQNMETPIYTTDAEGRITLFNKAAADLWGREPEIGKDLWCGSYKIFKSDGSTLPLDSCPMAVTLKEGRPVVGEEIIVVRPDGAMRNVAPHPRPIFDETGKLVGAVNMLIDITGIRRSEIALKESESKLRQLADSLEQKVQERTKDLKLKNQELAGSEEKYHKMIDEVEDYAIVLLDKHGKIKNWNKGAEKIKGYKESEIIGNNFRIFYTNEDREKGLPEKLLEEAREKGKALHEGWRQRKDGSRFWGSIVITALHDANRNIVGFSKVTRDLTERKLAEDKLIKYNQGLEFQNKELESFAYAASHDMKEPLRKINFYNNYIAECPGIQSDEKAREYVKRSLSAVKRMSDLIENLLTYSQINASIDNFEETDLNEMVDDIVLSHKELVDQQEMEIEVRNLPTINVIRYQFRQLFDNLISNSIKYKHPDRKLVIHILSSLVKGSEINGHDDDPCTRYHKISVIDNGIGFDPQYSKKIFDIFQRLSHQTGFKGSGIGLAICKRAVQNHHGIIKAIGEEEKGARFDIYIPVK